MDDLKIINAPARLRPQIEALCRATYDEHRARQPYAFPPNSFEQIAGSTLERAFQDSNGKPLSESPTIHAAMAGEDLAGYVALSYWAADEEVVFPQVEINDIAVVPELRGRGVGRALLNHVKTLADQNGWDNLRATVWAGNEDSRKLFDAAGFEIQSTSYRYGPKGPARDCPTALKPSPATSRRDFWLWLFALFSVFAVLAAWTR